MADTVNGIAFLALAVATLGGAIMMLSVRNVVHAAFWLLEVSLAAAGLYFLLAADYVALVQLLVYAGAVAILLLFTIMITMRRREDAIRPREYSPASFLFSVAFFAFMTGAIVMWKPGAVRMPKAEPSFERFGELLFSVDGWALPFEIASLVLTVALVAAVWWSKEDGR